MQPVIIETHVIPEVVVPGMRLGRHYHRDSRSVAFPVRTDVPIKSTSWARRIDVLDQGDVGSCTGNADLGALGTDPFFDTMPPGFEFSEKKALAIYEAATKLDNVPGSYPPDDTGSDGTSVAKATKNLGLISGYLHATDLNSVLAGLQIAPGIVGMNWYDSFDSPNPSGLVSISRGAQVRGGHEIELLAVDVEHQLLRFVNSWGAGWGDAGYFMMSFDTLDRLLGEGGDFVQFTPITEPVPVPTPVPTPTPTPVPTPTPTPVPTPTPPVSQADLDVAPTIARLSTKRYIRNADHRALKAWMVWLEQNGYPFQ